MENKFYVYEHFRKDNGQVFYVGKGTGFRAGLANRHHRSEWWLRIVSKSAGFDIKYVAVGLDEELSLLAEIERIDQRRRTGASLCNMTNGGDGTSGFIRSPESRAKLSLANKGRVVPDDVRKKISEAVKKAGYRHTDEARERISASLRGKKRSLGYKHSDEWKLEASRRAKGNAYCVGKKASAETRAKMSKSMSGLKQKVLQCPHCGTKGGNAMRRWHFESCKELLK